MSTGNKRTVTASLLLVAGLVVMVALVLPGLKDTAVASRTKPTVKPPVHNNTSNKAVKKVSVKVTAPAKATVKEPAKPKEPVKPKEPPKVDVVFALDTTGSMGGLIRGAKKKIWSIANQIASGQPRPDVRLGLIGYRDIGDAYVTRRYQLNENIDDIYSRLKRFRAGGGGDTPEHVNKALADAIRKMKWRKGQDVLRLIFLVGDAPPHEGRSGLYSRRLAKEATDNGIIINTVRCGRMSSTARAWKRIALASGGAYASIRQDGAMVAYKTPVDTKLAELNRELSKTLLPAGSSRDKAAARDRAMSNMAMEPTVQAESASFRARSGKLDSNDLLDQMAKGKGLDAFDEDELPKPVAAMPAPKRKAYVASVAKKRATLKAKIKSLTRTRKKYVEAQKKPSAPMSFDDSVAGAVKAQGKKIGVAY